MRFFVNVLIRETSYYFLYMSVFAGFKLYMTLLKGSPNYSVELI